MSSVEQPDQTMKKGEQDSVGIAEALGRFAEKTARMPHRHWYMGTDSSGSVTLFPEDIGLPMPQAVSTTVDTIKGDIAKELERIIGLRSQGIWYDLSDKKNDKMNETTLTGCSVIPTREVIKLWERLSGNKFKYTTEEVPDEA